ncbi:MAG: choice-of-anchor D domain-containing protein [Chloroflexota bacterium]
MKRVLICITVIGAIALMFALANMGPLATTAEAFETWSTARTSGNCADCHGDFRVAGYVSQSDGVAWNANLHDPHRNTWLGGQCNVCHSAASRFPVSLGASAGVAALPGSTVSCTGCHSGPGTRNHHELRVGQGTCSGCHGTEPVGRENTNPPYYGNALGEIPANSCNTAAAPRNENKFGATGLDNDGDGLYDSNDPDCAQAAPAITLNPAQLNLGTVTVGSTATLTTQIINSGTAALTISTIARATGTSTEFTFSTAGPVTVAAGASTTLTVTYTPTNSGTDAGSIVITSNATTSPTSLSVTGTGSVPPPTQPAISLSPTSLTFGTVNVGSSATLTTTVSNTGNAALNVSTIARATGTSAEYTFSPAGPVTVAAGGSTTLSVTYTPTASGTDAGTIVITSNAPTSPTSLSVTGTGSVPPPPAQPQISLNPTSLSFGTVNVGNSATLTTTISNTGSAALNISTIARATGTSAEFTSSPAGPVTVAAGGSTTLSVTYTPTASGTDTGSVVITSNASTSPTSLNVAGTGNVPPPAQPQISLSPTSLSFDSVNAGSSATLTTQIQNQGTATLQVSAVNLCVGTSMEFSTAATVPFTVPAGQSVTLNVTYAPTNAGADTGCVQIISNAPTNGAPSLNVTGTGVVPPPAQPKISLNPPALNFGTVNLGGSQTLTTRIENLGGADLAVTGVAPCPGTSNEFSFTAPSTPFSVVSGGNASVSVTYAPLAAGADTGCIQIMNGDPANPTVSLALTGTGATPPAAGAVDLDIDDFTATSTVNICGRRTTPVTLRLEIENHGTADGIAPVTLVGVQNGSQVYKQTATASVQRGRDAYVSFPPHAPMRTGTIEWTVTIDDQNSDVDVSRATTSVTCSRNSGDNRGRDRRD